MKSHFDKSVNFFFPQPKIMLNVMALTYNACGVVCYLLTDVVGKHFSVLYQIELVFFISGCHSSKVWPSFYCYAL